MMATLVLQTAAQVDTVVTVPARDTYDIVQALAAGSVAATFIGVLTLMLFTVIQVRRAAHAVNEARRQISIDPAVESLRRTASYVESISASVDREVSRMAQSVSGLSERLDQASDRMEERIEEFNALMEVVQSEAEGTFVDGASAARGVRAGIENLGSRRRRPPPRHRPESDDDL
ncbi:MAG: hypothetical protein WD013_04525 [Gemmatimonadota bacterium]